MRSVDFHPFHLLINLVRIILTIYLTALILARTQPLCQYVVGISWNIKRTNVTYIVRNAPIQAHKTLWYTGYMSETSQKSNVVDKPIDLRTIPRPTKKQRAFIQLWLNPKSKSFGNTYQSAIEAGFSDSTARVLTANSRQTPWIQDLKLLLTRMEPEHIYLAMQQIALDGKADRDKLKALELMGKHSGMFVERSEARVEVRFTNSVPRPIIDLDKVAEAEIAPITSP